MAYNMTLLEQATTVFDLVQVANTASNNILAVVFVLSIFFVLFFAIRTKDFAGKIAISGFLSTIISAMFWYMEILNPLFPLLFAVLTAFATLYLYMRN